MKNGIDSHGAGHLSEWSEVVGVEVALPPLAGGREEASAARFRSLVEAHLDTVWRSLRRLGVPEAAADDAAQQVFLVASRRLAAIGDGLERSYLLGVAVRVASEMRRAIGRRREVPLEGLAADSIPIRGHQCPPDEALDAKRALALLAGWLDEMPGKQREAFVLFELEELSATDVARILRVPVGTVVSRVRRARKHIRKRLTQGGLP
jgi:RNA polymerase sigma-70 factor, ECF subfamily